GSDSNPILPPESRSAVIAPERRSLLDSRRSRTEGPRPIALRAPRRRRRRARARRRLLRPDGPRGGVRRHPEAARALARPRARQAPLVPVRLAGRPAALRRALRAPAAAGAPPAVPDRERR